MQPELKPPPQKYSTLVVLGGIVTATLAIASLTWLANHLSKDNVEEISESSPTKSVVEKSPTLEALYALQDSQSLKLPGTKVTAKELKATKVPYIPAKATKLTATEMEVAQTAWKYFETNWNKTSGLVNSADQFPSVTLWDQSAAIAGLIAAKELDIIDIQEFETKMSRLLKTLAKLDLYNDELPNKVYNAKTLIPVDYGGIEQKAEIGWSAIDLGRMAIWLKIIGAKYPKFKTQADAVWEAWDVERLTKDGNMYGTSISNGEEQYNQEGRLGYENYAAFGLKLWGLDVEKALDYEDKTAFVNLYDVGIPYDLRDAQNSGANNYVLSEPYFLDGMETGFQALPKAYSDRILQAQEARYQKTKQLTAITEDNLDRDPRFVYNTLFVNGKPWSTITDTGENYNHLRFLSAKAAIGWHVLYDTAYTNQLFDFVVENLESKTGWYNGYYETLKEPNEALTANNNGIILESLLYKQVGKPLLVWAGVSKK
ncbi:DUF3131 domain-containing protein [Pleurocapsa sp. PCC 7319]|uniref:DUF3131 domain-containing protein n=1 Tax=Pleurocapsa sp. PCC 7319 TaxID=118161 RepID=UPI0003460BA1|nr:DUF3131 domain-containing protein [Pleurocapsa sp. PCC 7319]